MSVALIRGYAGKSYVYANKGRKRARISNRRFILQRKDEGHKYLDSGHLFLLIFNDFRHHSCDWLLFFNFRKYSLSYLSIDLILRKIYIMIYLESRCTLQIIRLKFYIENMSILPILVWAIQLSPNQDNLNIIFRFIHISHIKA